MYIYTVRMCYASYRQSWMMLQDLIATRSKDLAGAYEIHKFNNDANEILGRIQVSNLQYVYCVYVRMSN